MLQNNKEEIQNSINICKAKLKTILPHLTDEKPCLNITFNKLLIEKAILKDKLKQVHFFGEPNAAGRRFGKSFKDGGKFVFAVGEEGKFRVVDRFICQNIDRRGNVFPAFGDAFNGQVFPKRVG